MTEFLNKIEANKLEAAGVNVRKTSMGLQITSPSYTIVQVTIPNTKIPKKFASLQVKKDWLFNSTILACRNAIVALEQMKLTRVVEGALQVSHKNVGLIFNPKDKSFEFKYSIYLKASSKYIEIPTLRRKALTCSTEDLVYEACDYLITELVHLQKHVEVTQQDVNFESSTL